MHIFPKLVLLFVVLCELRVLESSAQSFKVLDTSHQLLSRNKRWLVWKEGINWIALIFGIGIPFEVDQNSVTMGMVIKAYYRLPDNSSYYTRPTIDYERRKRSLSRWTIYEMIETYLERNNYANGKACLLKSICEVAAIQFEERSGLLAEIVHTIFTPSSTNDKIINHSNNEYHSAEQLGREIGSCNQLFPECPLDPIKQFSRLMILRKNMY